MEQLAVNSGLPGECNKRFYFKAFDGWRFWAAVIVLIHHCSYPGYFYDKSSPGFVMIGIAMPFFFMISGFMAAASTQNRELDFSFTSNFLTKRAVRILPPHIISLLVYVAIFCSPVVFLSKGFYLNLFLLQGWIPDMNNIYSFNAPTWYLSVLFALFCFTPILVRNLKTCFCISILIPVLLSFFVPPQYNDFYFYIFPLVNIFQFLAGMFAYHLSCSLLKKFDQGSSSAKELISWTILEIAIIGILILFLYGFSAQLNHICYIRLNPGIARWVSHNSFVLLVFPFLCIYSMEKGFISKLLSLKFFQILGKVSFVMFVWHWVFLFFIRKYDLFCNIPVKWRILSFVLVTIALSFPLEYWVNEPISRFLSSLLKKHPLRFDFIRKYAALIIAILFFSLYLIVVLPMPIDCSNLVFHTMKSSCDKVIPDQIIVYPGNVLSIHPGEEPTSVTFYLDGKVETFSCQVSVPGEKGDVTVIFYLDNKEIMRKSVKGGEKETDISFYCSNANELKITVDKNGSFYFDTTAVKSISFKGKVSRKF